MYASIVVGTDGSSSATQAVEHAAQLARISGATLHIVSACDSLDPSLVAAAASAGAMVGSVPPAAPETDIALEDTTSLVESLARQLEGQGVTVAAHARRGSAASLLCDVASEVGADVIVVGSRGMTGVRRLLGSVPNSVAHHAPCSVLIVKTT